MENHYYVYMHRNAEQQRMVDGRPIIERGIYIYERTCGTEERAKERCKELMSRGDCTAIYLVNHIIKGAFY
jgi:hypothetical protein